MSSIGSIPTYDQEAAVLAERYESVDPDLGFGPLLDLLPTDPSMILDVGAGSGRDASWFARRGHDVIAVEPAAGMRAEGIRRHPDLGIKWVDDRLPGLEQVHRLGVPFDLILLSAVWQHIGPGDRRRAFRKLITLLKPGGRLVVTLRHGPSEPGRPMFAVSLSELEKSSAENGAVVVRSRQSQDHQGRADISWEHVVVQLADDGTAALPLIRHVVLNDAKSSTYKLALLRTVARAADASPGLALTDRDEFVSLPLGLIGLYWIRAFLPLVKADLPQTPDSRNGNGLGFVKEPFRALSGLSSFELRIGAEFSGPASHALTGAIRDAVKTIGTMPARYITYPGGSGPVFEVTAGRTPRAAESVLIDPAYLWAFGEFRIPTHVWLALTRLNAWIEPTLIAEWIRLMDRYLIRQGRSVSEGTAQLALQWLDPVRDTNEVRRLTQFMIEQGNPVHCVWTGRRLREANFDVDHCFPFASWRNGDLWNLMPSTPRVNRHEKGDRLVSQRLLDQARDRISDWWQRAYLDRNERTQLRFGREAQSSLPILLARAAEVQVDDVFEGLVVKRLMLKTTQGLNEWDGL